MGTRSTRLNAILLDIYRILFDFYGPQGWWPGETPFEVMIGAVLTQATNWSNAEKAIVNLKEKQVCSPKALREMTLEELATNIRPAGYYNAKAKKLKALMHWLERYGDDLNRAHAADTMALRSELLSIYGIGEETADSILLYAVGRPVFVIDAYTRRAVDRIGIQPAGKGYADYQRLFRENLPEDVRLFNEYHALLVRNGKNACRKIPVCPRCVLAGICRTS